MAVAFRGGRIAQAVACAGDGDKHLFAMTGIPELLAHRAGYKGVGFPVEENHRDIARVSKVQLVIICRKGS